VASRRPPKFTSPQAEASKQVTDPEDIGAQKHEPSKRTRQVTQRKVVNVPSFSLSPTRPLPIMCAQSPKSDIIPLLLLPSEGKYTVSPSFFDT